MSGQVWSTTGHHQGRYYSEVIFGDDTPDGGVGIHNEDTDTGVMLMADGRVNVIVNGVVVKTQAEVCPQLAAGDVVGIRADFDRGMVWFRVNGGDWNGGGFDWPDASNTGATGELTLYEGSYAISDDDVVLENLFFDRGGTLNLNGNNIILRNCRIVYEGDGGVFANGSGITVEDCTIIGPGLEGTANAGIIGSGIFRRNDISRSENGLVVGGLPTTVTNNYIHDLEAPGGHYDGLSVQYTVDGVLIENNTIISWDTSCIFIKNDGGPGPITNITINHNRLLGQPPPAFAIYVDESGFTGHPITNVAITNNVIEMGAYGYYSIVDTTPSFSGNVDYVTGLPI